MAERSSETAYSKQDYLGFATNKDTANIIKEPILFSDKIKKINSWNITQQRFIVITSAGVYNVDGTKVKRCLALKEIGGISKTIQASNLNEFVIHVPAEYDYRYQAESAMRREEVISVLKKQFVAQFNKNLPIYGIKAADLKEVTTLESDAKKKKSRIPDSSFIIASENLLKDRRASKVNQSMVNNLASNAATIEADKQEATRRQTIQQDQAKAVSSALFGGAFAASAVKKKEEEKTVVADVSASQDVLIKQNKKLESQVAMLKAQLESNAGGNATQIESLNEKNQRLTMQISELEEKLNDAKQFKEHIDLLEAENAHLKQKVDELDKQLRDSSEDHLAQIEIKDKELVETRSKIVALETDNITLKADLEKSNQTSKDSKIQIDTLQAKVDQLELELKLKGGEATDASQLIDEKYKKDLDRLSQNIQRLEGELEEEKQRSREAADLMTKVAGLQAAALSKDQTIENQSDKLAEKDMKINNLQDQIGQLELKNEQQTSTINSKNQENEKILREKERTQQLNDEQNQELIKVKAERQALIDQNIKKSQNSRQESEQKNAQLQLKIQELNLQIDEEHKKVKLMDEQMHKKKEELIAKDIKIKELEEQNHRASTLVQRPRKEVEMMYARDPNQPKSMNDFKLLKQIGIGCYGDVFIVDDETANEETNYAMKCIKKDQICDCKQAGDLMLQEEILCKIDSHPFIVDREYVFQKNDKLFILSQFMRGGDLFHHLLSVKRFKEEQAQFFAAQIALALGHFHQHDIIYKDLKGENILVQDNGYIKLADFGLAKFMKARKPAQNQRVSVEYCAPELLTENKRIDKSVDWWALGCVIYELLIGVPPFFAKDKLQLMFKIKESPICFPNEEKSGIVLSQNCKSFIVSLLKKNRKQRLGNKNDVEEVLAHPWLADLSISNLKNNVMISPYKPNITDDLEFFDQRIIKNDN